MEIFRIIPRNEPLRPSCRFDRNGSLMRLYLIRHAETVDNVAGLYAGVRDSKLTVHGTEQATRLGDYFSRKPVHFTHIFSSPLWRTVKTAEAIQKAQPSIPSAEDGSNEEKVEIVRVPDLIEQNFGYYEGKSFQARTDSKRAGRESDAERRRHDPGFIDVESREAMAKRADAFLDDHLIPLFDKDEATRELHIAIVSHGMLLSTLWRRLLSRLPRKSLTIAPEVTAARGPVVLEHLGGWNNTGYLELSLSKETWEKSVVDRPNDKLAEQPSPGNVDFAQEGRVRSLSGWSTTIIAIDSREHLVGLKRQRGGIGRQAHDEAQRKLDGFFTKRQRQS